MSTRPSPSPGRTFSLLVPVKALHLAKTRLVLPPDMQPDMRPPLMRAFALDALAAAAASPAVAAVHVVTSEAGLPLPEGAEVLPDEGDGDLNAALRHAERAVRLAHPERGVAAMCADLPALRTEDLTEALRSTTAARWYVADAHGTGTTLLAAGPGVGLDPHFGVGSADRHEQSGARPLAAAVPSLRHDVDTEADLAEAAALGLGRLTRAALGGAPRG